MKIVKVEKEYKVYTYDELNEDVKQELLEKEREYQYNDYYDFELLNDMQEESVILLEKYFKNATFKNVYYDLSYCQGSGAMIEFTINFEDLNNKYHILNDEEMRYVKDKSIVNEIEIYHNDNLYYHEYTFDIKYYDNFGYWDYEDIKDDYNINEEDFNTIEDRIIALLNSYNKHNTSSVFVEDIIDMNKELSKAGYDIVEHPIDDDFILDILRENEYYENGEIF